MASKPTRTGSAPPVSGQASAPVNQQFSGPDQFGRLNDVPPLAGYGSRPLVAVNGVDTPKLGFGGNSPKTKG